MKKKYINSKINSNNIIPRNYYYNTDICKYLIYNNNRHKSGIYCLYNFITNEIYIDSYKSLTNRFYCKVVLIIY